MKAEDLTPAERLLVERRRFNQSQPEAAARLKVTIYRFRRWEAGEDEAPGRHLEPLGRHEVCFIRRRRAGISLVDLADVLGVSRWWLCQMERGRCSSERLVNHWNAVNRPWRPSAAASTV